MIRLFGSILALAAVCSLFPVPLQAQETKKNADSEVITGSFDSLLGQEQDARYRTIFTELEASNNTLYDALSSAYSKNPTLQAARAELTVVEEQLPLAQAGLKPTISGQADITHTDTETEGTSFVTSDGTNTSKTIALQLEQPLFTGGTNLANISKAKHTIDAQNIALSATEQALLYEASVAYMDVYRDSATLKLKKNNYDLVAKQLEQAQNRFKVGELTRTDVSQSEARLAGINADVINAEGALRSNIAVYKRIVIEPPPINMAYPEKTFPLPETLEDALSLAASNNRNILQAKFIKGAAQDQVQSVRGKLFPQVSAIGGLTKSYDPSAFLDEQRQASIGLSASIPLYLGGANHARLREARKTVNQRDIQIQAAENQARQEAISNWEALESAQAEVKARTAQIEAARIAWQGVQYEVEFGERTTLDALDANQELLDAQVNFIIARRNVVVARFGLAHTLGLLVPQNLGFSTINP